eukprot:scaffold534_cov102-Isochrysis_galbana.AAC.5
MALIGVVLCRRPTCHSPRTASCPSDHEPAHQTVAHDHWPAAEGEGAAGPADLRGGRRDDGTPLSG